MLAIAPFLASKVPFIDPKEKTKVVTFFTAYICGVITARQFNKAIGSHLALFLRKFAAQSFECSVQYKMAMLLAAKHREPAKQMAALTFYGVSQKDIRVFEYLKREGLITALRKVASKIPMSLFTSLKDVQRMTAKLVQDVNGTIKKTSWKRLSIVAKSNNYSMMDMEADLIIKAIQIVYRRFPFITGQHLINSVRMGVVNGAINQIIYYQRKRRARFFYVNKEGGETQSTIASMDSMETSLDNNGSQDVPYNPAYKVMARAPVEDAMAELVDKNRQDPKLRKLSKLLHLEPSKKFHAFLQKQGMENTEPRSVVEKYGAEMYLSFVRTFLHMKKPEFEAATKTLATHSVAFDQSGYAVA